MELKNITGLCEEEKKIKVVVILHPGPKVLRLVLQMLEQCVL